MIKKNLVLGLFFVFNLFSSYYAYLNVFSVYFYTIILILQIILYYANLKYNFLKPNLKWNFISIFKTLMLILTFTIIISILKITSKQNVNLLTYVFKTTNYVTNFVNDFILKPTIVYIYSYNLKQNQDWKYVLFYALMFSIVLNIDAFIHLSFHKINIMLNWIFIYFVIKSVNIYFYNYLYVWIIFCICYIANAFV